MAASLIACAAVLAIIVRPAPQVSQADALIAQLNDERVETRDEASRKLVALGEPAIEPLTRALESGHAEVRERARRILDEIQRPILELPAPTRAKLDRVRAEVAVLREAGRGLDADALAARLGTLRRELIAGRWPSAAPEVHVIGVLAPRSDEDQHVAVRVTHDGPVVLVLCGDLQVFWRVEAAPGATVKKVVVGGRQHQGVEGLPDGVPVEKHVEEDGSSTPLSYCNGPRSEEWDLFLERVRKLAGPPSSIQGAVRYTEPFVVGPENASWVAQRRAAHADRFCDDALAGARQRLMEAVSQHAFWAVRHPEVAIASEVGKFTYAGPVKGTSFRVDVRVKDVVADDQGRLWGVTSSELLSIDPKTGAHAVLKEERRPNLPRISMAGSVKGVAYDSKRRRLLMVAGNTLYAIDPEKEAWSVLTRFTEARVTALAYAADADRTYVVDESHGERLSILEMNENGELVATIARNIRVTDVCEVQLACLPGKRLVLLVSELFERAGPPVTMVIDRTTGEIELKR
jgi:hypothetical protein